MGLNVVFWQFSKRENSTALPSGATPTTGNLSCVLKAPCGIINPSIEIAYSGNPTIYNYCAIEEFDRAYFVNDWTYENGVWVADLSVDVLGSNKLTIGASSQYVLRSASNFDGNILDTYYPTKYGTTITTNNITSNPYQADIDDGCYIVGLIGQGVPSDPGVGGVKYVGFTQTQINSFMTAMFSSTSYMGTISEIGTDLLRTLVNPFQYISSCTWFPFPVTTFSSGSVGSTYWGWWDVNISHYILNASSMNHTITSSFTIPKHPQAATRGAYLNMQPYAKYMLDFKPFGFIPIEGADLAGYSTLYTKMNIDLASGQAILTVTPTNDYSKPINIVSAQIGVPIQLAQISRDTLSSLSSIYGGIGGAVTGALSGDFAGGIMSAVSNITDAARSAYPTVQTSGANGSTASFQTTPNLTGTFYSLVDENNSHAGKPLCQEKTISTLSGYILVSDADFDSDRTATENRMIKNYMESGFFYE